MPCYTRWEIKVNQEFVDLNVLADGLRAKGFEVEVGTDGIIRFSGLHGKKQTRISGYYNPKTKQTTLTDGEASDADFLKVAYAEQAVVVAAKKYNWLTERSKTDATMTLRRRS